MKDRCEVMVHQRRYSEGGGCENQKNLGVVAGRTLCGIHRAAQSRGVTLYWAKP